MGNHFIYHDLGRIAYADALERQTSAFEALLEAKRDGRSGESQLLFCEHEPVFTIGKSGKDANLLVPEGLLRARGISYYHINRGGDITYHGPGQITGYPIFDLECWRRRYRRMARTRYAEGSQDLRHRREEQPLRYHAWFRLEYQYGLVLFLLDQPLRIRR